MCRFSSDEETASGVMAATFEEFEFKCVDKYDPDEAKVATTTTYCHQ